MKSISPHKLYEMANGDSEEYIRLMIREGWIIPKINYCICGTKAVLKQSGNWVCENHVKFGVTKIMGE